MLKINCLNAQDMFQYMYKTAPRHILQSLGASHGNILGNQSYVSILCNTNLSDGIN